MNLLALDTSTEVATVALLANGKMHRMQQNNVRQHAQYILSMIQTLMQNAHIAWTELNGIIFGAGPGSFTGLRIACSIAKALAYAHQLPLYGVSSLDTITFQVRQAWNGEKMPGILAIVDARMQEVYWAYYPPETVVSSNIQVGTPSTVQIPSASSVIIAGWGIEAYKDQWGTYLDQFLMTHELMAPEASAMIALVQTGVIPATTATEALPLYVRNQVTHIGEKTHG
ncbi:MAG TPA: tRNA (adenosine(37)-N6)-threonylcarbamoyltransferase complex dimerization subunit type 1 TsaB [Legionellaceae bacterium]|nr:tRNA (adenosine(37)-N6)-threonylcarbamoyltransferase complex dimerization subunit type 1 TsaB [Legionellaceae bacterium]